VNRPDVRERLAILLQRVTNIHEADQAAPDQRRGMSLLWLDGFFSSASNAFFAEFVVLYMMAIGASSATLGLRASINSAAGLVAPLVGAWLVARTGHRKKWVLLGPGGVARLCLVLMALVPFVVQGEAAVTLFVALLALQAFAGGLGGPAHNSLIGDIVPLAIRGRFLGSSMMLNNIATVLFLPLAGYIIRRIGGLGGYQVSWLVAAAVGLGATAVYSRLPEIQGEESRAAHRGEGMRAAWDGLRHDRSFLLYCLVNLVWTFGINLSSPFFTVHMVENLGFTADTVAYLATVTTVFNVIALRWAGDLVDKHGAFKVTAIAMLLVPGMCILWYLARTPFEVGIAKVYGFFAWAGFHVASLPVLLLLAPAAYRSQYVAVLNTVNAVAAVVGPLVAAWLYATYGFGSNLLWSAAGRLAGALLFVWFVRSGLIVPRPTEENGCPAPATA